MKTVFFGSSEFVLPVVEVLNKKFGLSLILTTEQQGPVIDFALKNKVPYSSVSKLQTTNYKLQTTHPDLGIVADFGLIIPKQTINLFPKGILNIHPSLLPKYRGPTPVQTVLLNGNKQTGVTIIRLDEKVDHGPILAQEEYNIEVGQTSQDLLKILFKLGANLLEKTLIDYIEDVLDPVPQDEKNASFTKLLTKKDGLIKLSRPPSKEKLQNMVRAFYPWPGVWTKAMVNGQWSIIKFLPGEKIQVEGKRPQSFKDFANGYKEGAEILKKLNLT